MATKRVQLVMSEELVAAIEKFAKYSGISRSGAISVLCSQALSQNQAFSVLPDIMAAYKREQDKHENLHE